MGGRSKILGWVVAGLVIMLALLTVLIVRNTAQSEPPDLSPVEVTPEPTETSEPTMPDPDADSSAEADSGGSATDGRTSDGRESGDADPQEIEHSYEPVPNPPREVPDDDDDDDGDDDDDDDDDDGDDDDD
ncbi:hypothetical protein [Brevibacterium linens]|uniref:hypothetical protein n=1 Tax=Brevibacterium linens TaxID=1703 RepID=UPI000FCAF0DE|nr:hypothetical protein [Brevibacterium linens]AZU01843.1 hypothetical protein CXR29_15020 [Brevibacterium linens]